MSDEDKGKPKFRLNFWIEWSPAYLWGDDAHTKDTFGVGPINKRLPVSDELRERANKLAGWYQDSLNWSYPPDPGPWRQDECNRFKAEARKIFKELQLDLGDDFELRYTQDEPDEDPDLDEYLRDPKNFKRRDNNRTIIRE